MTFVADAEKHWIVLHFFASRVIFIAVKANHPLALAHLIGWSVKYGFVSVTRAHTQWIFCFLLKKQHSVGLLNMFDFDSFSPTTQSNFNLLQQIFAVFATRIVRRVR